MPQKPTYEELEQRVKQLEEETIKLQETEETLRESEKRFRNLVATSSDWVWEINDKGYFTYSSPNVKDFLGYEPDRVIGKRPFEFMPADEVERVRGIFNGLFKEPKPFEMLEHTVVHREGIRVEVETNGIPVFDQDRNLTGWRGIDRNITKRKEAEETQRETENKYRMIVENAITPISYCSLDGYILLINTVSARKLGRTPEDITGRSIYDFFPDQADMFMKRFHKIAESGKGYEFEDRVDLPSGPHWFLTNHQPVKTGEGRVIAIQTISVDITSRKHTELALKENRALYRDLVETVNDIIWEADTNGLYTYISPRVYDILGYSPKDLIDSQFFDLMAPDKTRIEAETFLNITASRNPFDSLETTAIHKDGSSVILESSGKPFFDDNGEFLGYRGINRDITERNNARKSLIESEERFRTFLETANDFMHISNENGNLTYINESMARGLGYSKEELIGKNIADVLPNKLRAETWNLELKELITKGKITHENTFVTKDGRTIYGEIKLSAFYDQQGQFAGSRGVFRDLTEQKEKEKLQVQLQHAQKMEAIGTLAGGVAHDLNNILSGIVSYPDLLLMQLPANSPLRKPILTMQNTGQKAAAIVQDLLALARRGVAVTEVVDINEVIFEYLISPEYDKMKSYHPDTEIETDLDTDLMNILGSPVHLSKAIMNLVSNAVEAMPEGGKIRISTELQYVSKVIRGYDDVKEGDYVVVTVSDEGVGISSEDMDRIFEPFYTKKRMGRSGTGLGMAVVWGTVRDHKGYIDMKSIKGKGTTFTLFFPITIQKPAEVQSSLPVESYFGDGESILVVDDVKEQRQIASAMLSELRYSVSTASSGEKAVEYMKKNPADLLLLDMIMDPGIDGLETYKRILQEHPNQKAIIASGFSETDRVKEAEILGVGNYINKPYTLEKIGIAVKAELEKDKALPLPNH